MNEQSGIIGDLNEKWVMSQNRKEPNMALGESEYKDQKVVQELTFGSKSHFGREREEKMGEELGLEEDQVLVGFLPIFLLLCDQAT